MALVGFNLTKISVEKKNPISGQVNIKTNLRISDITEEKSKVELGKENTILRFDFEFTIEYEPKVASIKFEGHILELQEDKEAKIILKEWKTKTIDEDLRLRVSNVIWTKCNVKAFLLEEEIGLPIHIPLPRLTK